MNIHLGSKVLEFMSVLGRGVGVGGVVSVNKKIFRPQSAGASRRRKLTQTFLLDFLLLEVPVIIYTE